MKKLIIKLFQFELMQKKWGRKWMGGTYYLIYAAGVGLCFWSDVVITSCQGVIVKIEIYINRIEL